MAIGRFTAVFLLLLLQTVAIAEGFCMHSNNAVDTATMLSRFAQRPTSSTTLAMTTSDDKNNVAGRKMGELSTSEQTVHDIMCELVQSKQSFRIVVVGNGAILESTIDQLGPMQKVTQSPSTGTNMLTLALEDKSFEFHIQLAQVKKISFVERETPMKTMRIVRLVNESDVSMCSIILVDNSDEKETSSAAAKWFHGLIEANGEEVVV